MTCFHAYLYGHHLTLITDHKFLSGLFNQLHFVPSLSLHSLVSRVKFDYSLGFRASTVNGNADALNRLPLPQAPKQVPDPTEVVPLMEHLDTVHMTAADIKSETSRNP